MVTHPCLPLAVAALWAAPAAVLTSTHLPLAAAWAVLGLLWAVVGSHHVRRAGLAGLPALLAAMPLAPSALPHVPPGPVAVNGTVTDVVRAPLTGHSYVALGYDRAGLRLVFDGDVDLCRGDRIRVLARSRAAAVPGERATVHAVATTLVTTPGPWSVQRACAKLRLAMERALLQVVPGANGAMVATLVLGRATRPDHDLAAAHRATGLSHLLAVSGAHAAMLAFLLGLSSRGRHLGASRLRSTVVLAILFAYGAIAGAEPPVLRAVVAFALATCAARLGRPFGMATGLLAPALVTCLVEPAALVGPSFLLSYAAVIGLTLAYCRQHPDGLWAWLGGALRASAWATLMTAPLTLHFFGQLAPWTILLTPVCAPLVAAMLLLGLLVAVLAQLAAPLATVLALPLRLLADIYAGIVHAADALPFTPIPAWHVPPTWAMALAAILAVTIVLLQPRRRSVALACLLAISLWFVPLRPGDDASLTLFAVGHGQCALVVTSGGEQVLIDCGSLQGGYRAARAVDAALARRSIDLFVITHADQDHHNGTAALLQRVPVRRALLPTALAGGEVARLFADEHVPVDWLAPGEHSMPLPAIEVMAPFLPADADDNDQSLWLRATIGSTSVLLTGDAQELGVAAALGAGFAAPSDVLVLPHHGRRNANAAHLLARVRPRACLASAEVADGETALGPLARRFAADLWVTGQHGTIRLTAATGGMPASIEGRAGPRQLP